MENHAGILVNASIVFLEAMDDTAPVDGNHCSTKVN